jgi:hypothetical protein
MIPKSNTQKYKPITAKDLLKAANKIHKNSVYGGANIIYGSSMTVSLFGKNIKEKRHFFNKLKAIYRRKKLDKLISKI